MVVDAHPRTRAAHRTINAREGRCLLFQRAAQTRRPVHGPCVSPPSRLEAVTSPKYITPARQPYIRRSRTLTCTLLPLASVGRNDHVPRFFLFLWSILPSGVSAAQRTNQDRSDGVADRALRRVPGERPEEGLQRQGLWRHVRKTPIFFFCRKKLGGGGGE